MRIGLLVNPTAGRRKAAQHHIAVAEALKTAGHHVIDLTGPDAGTARANAQAHLSELDALVVVGGDGVVQLGASVVAGSGVPLGVVPLGSGNDNANALAIPKDVGEAVTLILRLLDDDPSGVPTDALKISTPSGTHWAMAVANCGLDAVVNKRANEMKRPKAGSVRYPLALLLELPRFAITKYTIEAEGWTWTGSGYLVAAANGGYMGGGMLLVPEARMDDGILDVVIVHSLNKARLLTVFPRIYAGTHVSHPAVEIRQARRLTITSDPERPVFADGEDLGTLPATIEVVPGAVRMLREVTE